MIETEPVVGSVWTLPTFDKVVRVQERIEAPGKPGKPNWIKMAEIGTGVVSQMDERIFRRVYLPLTTPKVGFLYSVMDCAEA